jgi:hypothetical protein
MEMRSTTISYSKNKARETRETINKTIIQIDKLEKEINTNPTDEKIKEYNEGKKYIEQYNNEKTQAAQIRSKVNWTEFGEKNSKFFLNLEKRNYKMKCITKLVDESENEITDQDEILKYEKDFYNQLYTEKQKTDTPETLNTKTYFKDESLPKITNDEKQRCDSEITLQEIGIALKELQNGKSPGSDGFTTDFYKFFCV